MNRTTSEALYSKARALFPGGVNSPVRAFKSVGGTPLFIQRGDGPHIWDADGNRFIDFCCSWGPLILGHNPPDVKRAVIDAVENGTSFGAPTELENRLGQLIIDNHPLIDKIRFVSSGTEAVMSAIRLARGVTGKNKVIKFEGCYHGHMDALLVNAGSGLATFGTSSSAGIPESFVKETIVLPLNSEDAVEEAFEKYGDDIAAIIIEPIPANNGLLIQRPEYLQFLRKITSENDAMLIFDEVISGFRIGFTGAAGYYNISPDIITFGKIIGGGMPVGAYAASKEIMGHISPDGDVYQAGTLSGNPVAMAAGIAQLQACLKDDFYDKLSKRTSGFVTSVNEFAARKGLSLKLFSIGSIFWFAFTERDNIRAAHEIGPESMQHFNRLHAHLLENGIYLGPSGYEVGFVSAAHTDAQLDLVAEKIMELFD